MRKSHKIFKYFPIFTSKIITEEKMTFYN